MAEPVAWLVSRRIEVLGEGEPGASLILGQDTGSTTQNPKGPGLAGVTVVRDGQQPYTWRSR